MTDIRENWEDLEETIRIAVNAAQHYRYSNLRVTVSQDSQDGHTAVLQPVTQANVLQPDGSTVTAVDLPVLQDCPIFFPGGGGVTSTHPVKSGDEGSASFASAPIDTWHQQGDTQPPIDGRTHALSDATYHPGGRSDPRKLQNVSTVSGQHRSDDGNHFYDTHPQNGLTHQSTNMVLASVANTAAHLITAQGHQINAPKVCLNCG